MRRRDLPVLHGGDADQDCGHGGGGQGVLPQRDVEQAGLLHRARRVRRNKNPKSIL